MTKDEALKMAIAEIEGWIDHAYGHTPKECADNKAIKACKEALAQPAQEPVAYTDEHKNFLEWDMVDLCDKAVCKKHEAVPLYTHPAPAKEWVGLSYEEADGLILQHQHEIAPFKFVRAIEQALKEKNHD